MTSPLDNSEFAIHNRMEIVFTLTDLAKGRSAIHLDANQGVSLLTTILSVNSDKNYVLVDCSQDSKLNEKIIGSGKVHFHTSTGVKVRWYSDNLRIVARPDGNVFSFPMPDVIERVQRRQYFRLNTPQGKGALVCRIPLPGEEEKDDENVQYLEATILDMSAGGICVTVKGGLPESFTQGMELSGCSFELPEVGRIPVGLRICRAWHVRTHSGENLYRVGMEFINLSRGASNVIQRYMIELEKHQLSTS